MKITYCGGVSGSGWGAVGAGHEWTVRVVPGIRAVTSPGGSRGSLPPYYNSGMDETTEPWHGTPGGYTNHGCRLDCCRAAWRAEMAKNQKRRREQGLPPGDSRHGTKNGYRNYGCKCELCTAATRKRSLTKSPTVG